MPFPKDNKAAAAMPVFSFRMVVFLFCRDFPKIRSGICSNNTVSKPIAAAGVAAKAQTAAWHDMLIAGRRAQCCTKAHFSYSSDSRRFCAKKLYASIGVFHVGCLCSQSRCCHRQHRRFQHISTHTQMHDRSSTEQSYLKILALP